MVGVNTAGYWDQLQSKVVQSGGILIKIWAHSSFTHYPFWALLKDRSSHT